MHTVRHAELQSGSREIPKHVPEGRGERQDRLGLGFGVVTVEGGVGSPVTGVATGGDHGLQESLVPVPGADGGSAGAVGGTADGRGVGPRTGKAAPAR